MESEELFGNQEFIIDDESSAGEEESGMINDVNIGENDGEIYRNQPVMIDDQKTAILISMVFGAFVIIVAASLMCFGIVIILYGIFTVYYKYCKIGKKEKGELVWTHWVNRSKHTLPRIKRNSQRKLDDGTTWEWVQKNYLTEND